MFLMGFWVGMLIGMVFGGIVMALLSAAGYESRIREVELEAWKHIGEVEERLKKLYADGRKEGADAGEQESGELQEGD